MSDDPHAEEAQRNLTALRRHDLFPFPDYRTDDQQYMLLEMYWAYLFKSSISGNAGGAWRAWLPSDRTLEGNPIFSAIHAGAGIGVRVIQHPEAPRPGMPAPAGYFGFEPFLSHTPSGIRPSDNTVLELCFVADLSAGTEVRCREFWRYFCVEGLSEAQMEEKIREYELSVGMPEPASADERE